MNIDKYEAILVLKPQLDESAVDAVLEKFTGVVQQQGGKLLTKDNWGKRELAYPIAKENFGIYILIVFEAQREAIAILERMLRIDDSVIRQLIVAKDRFAPDLVRRPSEHSSSGRRHHGGGERGGERGGDRRFSRDRSDDYQRGDYQRGSSRDDSDDSNDGSVSA